MVTQQKERPNHEKSGKKIKAAKKKVKERSENI
jgi:hypothetical protein